MHDEDFKAEHEEDMAAERMFDDSDTLEEDWDSGEYLSNLEQDRTSAEQYFAEPEFECYVCQRSIWTLEDGIELTFRTGGAQFTVVVCSDDCRALTGA
jgi:hypothetical protein